MHFVKNPLASSLDARPTLAAVLTAYRPSDDLFERFAGMLITCRWIIIVDNTPGGHPFGERPSGFVLLQDGVNKGLGPALNLGVLEAQRHGAEQVFLFDQDSTPDSELLSGLLAARASAWHNGDDRVAVGPRFVDDSRIGEVAADSPAGVGLRPMSCLPTSGMLLPVGPFVESGGFAADLFLDFVDFEWCWRTGMQGWRFYRANHVPMYHRLGIEQRRIFGLSFHVPTPYRHYFQFRDTLRLAVRSYVPIYAKLRFLMLLPLKFLVYPWLLDRGRERLIWMTRGIADAFMGKSGAGAAAARLGA